MIYVERHRRVVDAKRFDRSNLEVIIPWLGNHLFQITWDGSLELLVLIFQDSMISHSLSHHQIKEGDYIVKRSTGGFFPMTSEEFDTKYEVL